MSESNAQFALKLSEKLSMAITLLIIHGIISDGERDMAMQGADAPIKIPRRESLAAILDRSLMMTERLAAMTEQWRKTNGEYERVSKALCKVQEALRIMTKERDRQLATTQQEIARLRELIRSGDCCRTLCSLGGAELR